MGQESARHPGVAAVLSFIFNGLGQLYNGQLIKGLLIIFLSTLGMLILIYGGIIIGFWLLGKFISLKVLTAGAVLFILGLILICVVGIYSIFDAYRFALKK